MAVCSNFQLCHLKTLNFSSHYHFLWLSWPFRPFFLKNAKKSEFQLFGLIFRKMALDMQKLPSESPGMSQMASFRMVFNPTTYNRFLEKVCREPSNNCRHPLLKRKKKGGVSIIKWQSQAALFIEKTVGALGTDFNKRQL